MVRTKFRCNWKSTHTEKTYNRETRVEDSIVLYDYNFTTVYTGSEENTKFFAATPSGSLTLSCVRNDLFTINKEYYLDLSPAVPL
ncbi:MAG: hypothetical protein ABSF21_00110 [Dehalococcoidia bacterium]|jgi:hypothetical protein